MQANRNLVDPTSINLPELSPEEVRRGLSRAKTSPLSASVTKVGFITLATLGVMLISYFVGFKSGSESGALKAIELQSDNSIRLPIFQPIAPKNDDPISATSELIAPHIFKENADIVQKENNSIPVKTSEVAPLTPQITNSNSPLNSRLSDLPINKNSETKLETNSSVQANNIPNSKNISKANAVPMHPFYRFSLGKYVSGEAAIVKLAKKGLVGKLVKRKYGGFDVLVGPFEDEAGRRAAISQINRLNIR